MKKLIALMLATAMSIGSATVAMAGSGDVFAVGYDMTEWGDKIDTTGEARRAANNIEDAGYNKILVTSKPKDSNITFSRLNSDIVFLAGHGTSYGDEVFWITGDGEDDHYNVSVDSNFDGDGRDISDYEFTNPKFVIISACYSGQKNGIAHTFELNGAEASIGWLDSVNDNALSDYTDYLTKQLADGETIRTAIQNTNMYLLSKNYQQGSPVFDYQTYGDVYSSITKNNRKINNIENKAILFNDDYIYYDLSDKNDNDIVNYLKSIDENFNENNFDKYIVETLPGYDVNDCIIAYRYKVGNVLSDFGYNVSVVDGKVERVCKCGKEIYGIEENDLINRLDLKTELIEVNKKYDNASVVKQDKNIFFDSETKKLVCEVSTTIEDDKGYVYCMEDVVDL